MLIAEDLLLLLLDDKSGKWTVDVGPWFWAAPGVVDEGVGGALLVELALGGHVKAVPWRYHKRPRVEVARAPAPSDPVLVSALARIAEQESSARELLWQLGEGRREPLLERLEAAGFVRRHDYKGWVPGQRRRWPTYDSRNKDALRRRLGDVLVRRLDPDPRTAGLIALLDAIHGGLKIDLEGTAVRPFDSRVREVTKGAGWAAKEAAAQIRFAQA